MSERGTVGHSVNCEHCRRGFSLLPDPSPQHWVTAMCKGEPVESRLFCSGACAQAFCDALDGAIEDVKFCYTPTPTPPGKAAP